MKKQSVIIFLPLLFLLAFTHANFYPVQQNDLSSSVITKQHDCFNVNLNYPHSEIERYNITGHTILDTQQGLQKIPGYLTGQTKSPVTSSLLPAGVSFSEIELFDNNYLFHNYPSHNFW